MKELREKPNPPESRSGLVRAAGTVGSMTLLSRVLGMFRDIVSARQFGTSWQWDAFVLAFMLPNFFRRVVGEGALSSAFIPVYSDIRQQHGQEAAFRYGNAMVTLLGLGITVFLCAAEGLLEWLLRSGLSNERLILTLSLLRILFPYLLVISLYALGMGILNAHRSFLIPSVAPVILNIFWIAGVLWIAPAAARLPEDQLHVLAWVLLGAGALQFLAELPPLYRLGFRLRWITGILNAGVRRTFRLLMPALLGFAVIQINLLVDMGLAFFIGPGANSSLWYGTRLMQFPLGVFAFAIGTALLPMISDQAARKDREGARETMAFALRMVFVIILPCTVGLMVLAVPIVRLLFERGEFDAASTARTASVLFCYAAGLFAYSGQKIVTAGFHAVQDTRTPVKIGVFALVSNVLLNLAFMPFLQEAGLALATSVSAVMQFILLVFFYHRRITAFPFRPLLGSFAAMLLAAAGMGVVCRWVYAAGFQWISADASWKPAVAVLGSMTVSAAVYFVFCHLLRVHEVRDAWDRVRRKRMN